MDSPPIPFFNWGALPEEEHERARHIQNQLLAVQLMVEFFQSAVLLVVFAHRKGERHWPAMAADSAILTLYNFRSTLNSILDSVGRCPVLKRKVSTKRLDEIIRDFDSAFPNWLALRDGVAHYSDKIFAPPKDWELRLDLRWSTHGSMDGNTMRYFVKGRTVSQRVSPAELENLANLKKALFQAFRKASQLRPGD